MSKEVTPWFPPEVKPARVGVYETDPKDITFQYWNGRHWGACSTTSNAAKFNAVYPSYFQNSPWRGLAKKP